MVVVAAVLGDDGKCVRLWARRPDQILYISFGFYTEPLSAAAL